MKKRMTNPAVIIPAAGNRNNSSGALNNQGSNGNYWSSSITGTNAYNLNFNSTAVNPANNNNRANGFSVRCIQHSPKKDNGDTTLLLALFRAYFDARKNKRSTANALAFEDNYEQKLFALCEDIIHRRYVIGRSICFIVQKPVKREVFAADFRDRIVHHLLFNYLNPIFEPHFIADSYSCRKGKGTSAGIRRLQHFIRSCSENHAKECYILKLDIQGYFMSMDKNILYTKIEREVREAQRIDFDVDTVLYLTRLVIFNDPTKNFVAKSRREDWVGLPKSKSLFFAPSGTGFPVGNLTSQLFSNIYLNDFDHYIREELGIERYGRYVDDMVFVGTDQEALKSLVPRVRDYLCTNLGLTLHPKKIYLQKAFRGVNFLGTYIKPWRTYVGRRTKRNLYARLGEWNARVQEGGMNEEVLVGFLASINSYLGMLRHYDTFKLRSKAAARVCRRILDDVVFSSDVVKGSAKAAAMLILCAGIALGSPMIALASAPYLSSGTVVSANLLANESASSITDFYYNLTTLPGNSSVTIQFSNNGTNWYSSTGTLGGSNMLSTLGGTTISLSGLGWSGSTFQYRITLNATSDLTASPVLSGVRLDYIRGAGYESMLSVDSASGNVEVGGGGGAGGSALSVLGGAVIGQDYFSHTTTNGILVEGYAGFGTFSPSSQLTLDNSGNGKFFEALNSGIASGKGGMVLSHFSDSGGGTDVTLGNNYYLNGSGSITRQDLTNSGWDIELNNRTGYNNFALNYINVSGAASTFLTVTSSGKMGVSTSSPSALLTVQGSDTASTTAFNVLNGNGNQIFGVYDNGNSTYSGSIFQSSDQRLKTGVQTLNASSTLAQIMQLNPVSYVRIDQPGTGENLGFIAQQVQQLFPQLVSTSTPTALTPTGTLSLNYEGLISPIVSAVQAIEQQMTALANTVAGFAQHFVSNEVDTNKLCVQGTCVTGPQLQALLAAANQTNSGQGTAASGQGSGSDTSSSRSTDHSSLPTIQINGNNPATVQVGASYADLGATITGPQADLNLDIKTFVNGAPMSPVVIDTSAAATDTIDYVVTDTAGNTSTSTRTVIIEAPSTASDAASATDATSTTGE